MRSVHRWSMLALGLVLTVAVAACSGGTTPTTGPTAAGTTQGAATQQPGSSSVATTAPTKPAAAGTAAIDLTFTGTKAFTAKGSVGRCLVIKRTDGTFAFSFSATEADYPGLGIGFSMANLGGAYVDVKWVVDASTAYGNSQNSPIVLSADHHSIQVDMELSPFTAAGGSAPGPEHVKGTVACP